MSSTLLDSTAGNAVALAESELVGIVKTGRARLACDVSSVLVTWLAELNAIVLMPSLGSWSFPRSR
ncbi:MAG TPA: hypothetical protein VM715_11905, partial [Candidatus Acidoferrum sp.]|nr:hypothetical protein [Candidatus Acidoferrum sp.]